MFALNATPVGNAPLLGASGASFQIPVNGNIINGAGVSVTSIATRKYCLSLGHIGL